MFFLPKLHQRVFLRESSMVIGMLIFTVCQLKAQGYREIEQLKKGWFFAKQEMPDALSSQLNGPGWTEVTVPHDWAISGPFSRDNDQQSVRVTEDGEAKEKLRIGRTGGLPFFGIGWYRRLLPITAKDKGKNITVEFDGAMSNARIFLNGKFVGEWPYGYTSFQFNITPYVNWNGINVLAVRLENQERSSRWYPGAGLYRMVRLVKTNAVHVSHWGTFITTPSITSREAKINIRTQICNELHNNKAIVIRQEIYDPKGHIKGSSASVKHLSGKLNVSNQIVVANPELWSAEHPALYRVKTTVLSSSKILDVYYTTFGIRDIRFSPDRGMTVNGIKTKLKGVCLHDDLGALGMAFNKAGLRHRLKLLKAMGCNAIRGTHNPHAPEMLKLCDEMGFYYIDEAFDEWRIPKVENGYHRLFDNWAEKDLQAMIERDRNHPALIMYSIGNEIKEATTPDGAEIAKYLTMICKRADPTRPVTAGINVLEPAIDYGFAKVLDIPGWNYKPEQYSRIHQLLPDKPLYGSETASTVSSRGAYHLPAAKASMKIWPDNQASSYDLEYCSWSQLPDVEWMNQDKNKFVLGEFVWTGTDYLGEPSPYNDNWPSRSSYFGMIDLAGLPKDRYYLYQSRWSRKKVLHVLPHWNWPERVGKIVPVFVYTNYPEAELFINGKSFGRKRFKTDELLNRYRLRWDSAIYQPGELKVVAYDAHGRIAATRSVKTAKEPARIVLEADRNRLVKGVDDLCYVTVKIVDREGNLCPDAENLVSFEVSGSGTLRAVDNGNPATTEPFQANYRKAFNGKLMAIIQAGEHKGIIKIRAFAKQLSRTEITVKVR
ncbi:DUF4982 domain-containing protein [Mucilaginibacter sp. RS28]|uniref:DUF4982 domain-containing protein n=1 Tax=Mucilaginibacter straminoryzae TaxID=2932774 RepID=A0A9X1X0I9_9SPHI|nr:beta-galactosidase GalB [Mucilaginibacter straminoryzae]MCJ8209007.1 DUF4982 domain-containing protein [Mucilaginibacter straminoryzae]